jgi:predicted DsbA family dithiol-disulfide isomerase
MEMNDMSTKVEVFVDYVCPYCFLMEPAVEQLRRDRDVKVEIRPFELRPDPVPTLRPEDDYLPAIWGRSVYPMARQLGMPLTLPSVSPQPRTEKAFLVLQLASENAVADEYSRAVFQAFFQDDRDIGRDDVLVDVATSVGLEPAATEQALISPERRARHAFDLRDAAAIGVSAVPSFLVEDRLIPGVADATRLTGLVDRIIQEKAAR